MNLKAERVRSRAVTWCFTPSQLQAERRVRKVYKAEDSVRKVYKAEDSHTDKTGQCAHAFTADVSY